MIEEENHKTRKSGNLIATLSAIFGVLLLMAIVGFVILAMINGMFNRDVVMVDVPNLRFQPFTSEEQLALEYPDLRFFVQTEYSADHDANVIIDQEPLSNRQVPVGTEIVLTVSTGREPVDFIDLAGMSRQEAQTWLTNNDLIFEQSRHVTETHDTIPRDHVISTRPAFGEKVYKGDKIVLTLSLGPEAKKVTMPSLLGSTVAEAGNRLDQYNLVEGSVKVVPSNEPAGTIVGQSIDAGETVEEKTAIDLEVSEGPEEITSPPPAQEPVDPTPTDNTPATPPPTPTTPTDDPATTTTQELVTIVQPIGIPPGIEGTTTLTVELRGNKFFEQEVRADEGTVYVTIIGYPDDVVRVWFDGTMSYERTIAALLQQLHSEN